MEYTKENLEKIIRDIAKAMEIGKKEAYADIFCIVSGMSVTDSSKSLKILLNILHGKVSSAGSEDEE